MILKSEIYNFHRLDLARRVGFIATVYDEGRCRSPVRIIRRDELTAPNVIRAVSRI